MKREQDDVKVYTTGGAKPKVKAGRKLFSGFLGSDPFELLANAISRGVVQCPE